MDGWLNGRVERNEERRVRKYVCKEKGRRREGLGKEGKRKEWKKRTRKRREGKKEKEEK